MPIALVLILVVVSSSTLVFPMVLAQLTATRQDQQRAGALHEARSGLEVALARIRDAQDAFGVGVPAQLPCEPLSGRAGSEETERYRVSIDYFTENPAGRPDTWIVDHRIPCLAQGGTSTVPAYALLRSRGQDGTAVRTLSGSYRFRITNANVSGGAIRAHSSSGVNICIDAGSEQPRAGDEVHLQPCDPARKSQKFSYNSDLTLSLVSSMTTAQPFGMCLDAGSPLKTNESIRMQPCAAPLPPRQQWSYAEAGRFAGTTDGKTLNEFCLNVAQPDTPGSALVLGSTNAGSCDAYSTGAFDNRQTFYPEATTGAGGAGADNGQLMNFGQFSRCIDVTWRSVDMPYLMSWPCKQAPDPLEVYWNQKWTFPRPAEPDHHATGMISTVEPQRGRFCMRSPGSTAPGQYVNVTPCPALSSPSFSWTVFEDTGDYLTSYRIIDGFGNCLDAGDQRASPPDYVAYGDRVTKLVVRPCSGSALQKWNAPAYLTPPAPLQNITEQ
jgi:hypothetical protein